MVVLIILSQKLATDGEGKPNMMYAHVMSNSNTYHACIIMHTTGPYPAYLKNCGSYSAMKHDQYEWSVGSDSEYTQRNLQC